MPPDGQRGAGVLGGGAGAVAIARRVASRVESVHLFDPFNRMLAMPDGDRICVSASAEEMWSRSDVAISHLEDEAQLRTVLGECWNQRASGHPSTLLELSPISASAQAELSARCRDANVALIGGRVAALGGEGAARSVLFVDDAALSQPELAPLLDALADEVVPTGAAGNAKKVGMLVDLLVGVNTAIVDEAIVLGTRSGIDAATLVRLVGTGSGANAVLARARTAPRGEGAHADEECASLRRGLARASAMASQVDHSMFFGSLAISSLLGRHNAHARRRT